MPQYGREKLGREGWLPQVIFYLGFVSQGHLYGH